MAIRYDSAHRGLISFLSFFFNITIANSFVQMRECSISNSAASSSSYKILRSVYSLSGVSHAVVTKSRADLGTHYVIFNS